MAFISYQPLSVHLKTTSVHALCNRQQRHHHHSSNAKIRTKCAPPPQCRTTTTSHEHDYESSKVSSTSSISTSTSTRTKTKTTTTTTKSISDSVESQFLALTAAMLGFSVDISPVYAAIPDGLKEAFKSKPASLAHPVVMWGAVATTLYAFWLGYQSSRIRQVDAETRKKLVKARVTDRHFQVASTLFAVTSVATFSGMANTYTRAGKLFPGPHLYAGLGIIALMSVMSAFVPHMQKGKNWARNSHFASAFIVTSLFVWQAKSGMVIVGKLLGWK